MSVKISKAKIEHMKVLSNEQGVISAAAMDQRGSLKKSIAAGKGQLLPPALLAQDCCSAMRPAATTTPALVANRICFLICRFAASKKPEPTRSRF
jgi:hypothetical protein